MTRGIVELAEDFDFQTYRTIPHRKKIWYINVSLMCNLIETQAFFRKRKKEEVEEEEEELCYLNEMTTHISN